MLGASESYICSMIDARNDQVYCGIFDKNYSLCTNYMADNINNVLEIAGKYTDIVFVGDGYENIYDKDIHAKNIGLAAYKKHMQGIKYTPDEVVPEYLRPSAAERIKGAGDL